MSRYASPDRDKRVLNLAGEIADTKDRRVPILLMNLKGILSSVPVGSKEAIKLRHEIWDYNLLHVLLLVLKQDFSIVDGDWQTAAALAAILSQVCAGMVLKGKDRNKFETESLPEAINNLFLLARRIQTRYSKLPNVTGIQKDRQRLMVCYRGVLESITYIASGHVFICRNVIESPWLLQLLISDDADTVAGVMDLLPKILRVNRKLLKELDTKLVNSIMDELVYKLSVNNEVQIGAAATKCVLRICDFYKPMVDTLCTRYKGVRPLLGKWEGRGFGKDLKDLNMLLQAGNAQMAELEQFTRAAILIQTRWRGFITRVKLQRADKAFTKFQRTYRKKKTVMEKRKEQAKEALELQRQLKLNRQRIMRDFKEKQLQSIEILPAAKVEGYLQKEETQAAVTIQRLWRGHHVRKSNQQRTDMGRQVKAAIKIQQAVKIWLERLENRKKKARAELKPPGLNELRRVELQKEIRAYREENPARYCQKDDLEMIHNKASEMLARYYMTARPNREKQTHREALIGRIDRDSELLSLAPGFDQVIDKDVEMFSSRSVPVSMKAKTDHMAQMEILRKPWYKKLVDQYMDREYEEEDPILF
ncbi:IQ calmodulin-binding motif-containing protein 1-like [Pecten maximus]|uniref:IQ calmodulin-binding motif-containing protein 1-like n=1 Tax=Pecten maximus TaxID=6579 RepID=UPI001457FE74|nr:IQ calmodulin-binding motif-containing protein 1-like [Pecten maximus]